MKMPIEGIDGRRCRKVGNCLRLEDAQQQVTKEKQEKTLEKRNRDILPLGTLVCFACKRCGQNGQDSFALMNAHERALA